MKLKTTKDFISTVNVIHGSVYDYSKVDYVNTSIKVCIICPEHGEFWQTPSNHLQGKGCFKCSRDKAKLTIKNKLYLDRVESVKQPNDYKLIKLNNGQYTMVDNEDFDRVKDYPWCIKDGYAYNRLLGRMHRYIMNAPDDMLVDHKEVGNTLDNRRSNLRLATRSQNSMNAKPRKNSSSKFKGVCWSNSSGKWRVQITANGVDKVLGDFEDEIEGAKYYDLYAVAWHGEFAYLNFPELKEYYLKQIEDGKIQ